MDSSQPEKASLSIDVNGPGHVDALGRAGFARELLEVIRVLPAERGAVVGLEGEWGSGKTWILERLDSLNEEPADDKLQVLFVRFNPWMVSGSAEIVETFLIQLASELGTTNRRSSLQQGAEIADKLIEYTGVLSTVKHLAPVANLLLPGSGPLLEAAAHAAGAAAAATKEMTGSTIDRLKKEPGKLSLVAAREAVKKLLAKAERRIAVLVDDLDRLPPTELASIVQAIKAVADFPNVIYVLAYDRDTAAHALEGALRLREGEGRRYLEKIVQVPMPVPDAPAFKMQEFAVSRLQRALGDVGAEDGRDVAEALPRAAALMRSPRDVLRLETRLALSARKLIPEISPADVLLVEALNFKAPHVIDYVHQHSREMLRVSGEAHNAARMERGELGDSYEDSADHPGTSHQERLKAKWIARRDALEQPINDQRIVTPVRNALAYLFDAVPRDLHFNEAHASRHRIQKFRNWSRWRSAVRHEEVFENSEVGEMLRRPLKIKTSRAWADLDAFQGFCALAVDLAGEVEGIDALAFVDLLVEAAQRFDEQSLRYDPSRSLGYGPQDALIAVIRADRARARLALERLIEHGSVWLSEHAVWTVHEQTFGAHSHPAASGDDRLVSDENVVRNLVQRWQYKAMDWLREVSEPHPGRPAFTLANWMHLMRSDVSLLREALTRIIKLRPRGLEICFCHPEYSDGLIRFLSAPNRDLLPEPDVLSAALSRSPGFKEGRELLCQLLMASTPATDPPPNQSDPSPTTPGATAPATAA
jgi:hypothetical protein